MGKNNSNTQGRRYKKISTCPDEITHPPPPPLRDTIDNSLSPARQKSLGDFLLISLYLIAVYRMDKNEKRPRPNCTTPLLLRGEEWRYDKGSDKGSRDKDWQRRERERERTVAGQIKSSDVEGEEQPSRPPVLSGQKDGEKILRGSNGWVGSSVVYTGEGISGGDPRAPMYNVRGVPPSPGPRENVSGAVQRDLSPLSAPLLLLLLRPVVVERR